MPGLFCLLGCDRFKVGAVVRAAGPEVADAAATEGHGEIEPPVLAHHDELQDGFLLVFHDGLDRVEERVDVLQQLVGLLEQLLVALVLVLQLRRLFVLLRSLPLHLLRHFASLGLVGAES